MWRLAILLIGCGRIGFDGAAGTDAPGIPPDGVASTAWDENLGSVTPPTMLAPSAHWVRVVDDGDDAWVAWAEMGGAQKVRYARLDADGHVTTIGVASGQLDDSLGHYHTLQHAGQSTVALWTDTARSRTFSAMRLCR